MDKSRRVFNAIKIALLKRRQNSPLRVLVNGAQGAGKTIFALELLDFLKAEGFDAFHVSIDGFHNLSHVRYQLGRDSAEGYYRFAYDIESFREKVLLPLQEEQPRYTPAIMSLARDEGIDLPPAYVSANAICIVDGAFLLIPSLLPDWDFTIYLQAPLDVAMDRGAQRDSAVLGGLDAAKAKYRQRYHQAYQLYLKENQPEKHADMIVDNSDYTDRKIRGFQER